MPVNGGSQCGERADQARYFDYLKEAQRYSEAAVDHAAKALARFEEHTRHRDFRLFHVEVAKAFKRHLAEQVGEKSGDKLSKATLHATLSNLRRFFHWLAGQPGYRSRLRYSDSEYFNLSEKDTRVATARRERPFPTLEQVRHVIASMPAGSDLERRNRALVAFALLTGARDSAIASIKLKHIDIVERRVFQDAREVKTKNSKSFETFFFPVGDDLVQILVQWVRHLREVKLWGNDEPLFPSTETIIGRNQQFEASGLSRRPWKTAAPIRRIFQEAFTRAGFPYFNPHSLRKTLVQLGEVCCRTPEEFKAWSQNLGHEEVMTTFSSYGAVPVRRQGEILLELTQSPAGDVPLIEEITKVLRRHRGGNTAAVGIHLVDRDALRPERRSRPEHIRS